MRVRTRAPARDPPSMRTEYHEASPIGQDDIKAHSRNRENGTLLRVPHHPPRHPAFSISTSAIPRLHQKKFVTPQ